MKVTIQMMGRNQMKKYEKQNRTMRNKMRPNTILKGLILFVIISNGLIQVSEPISRIPVGTQNYESCPVISASYGGKTFLGANIDASPYKFSKVTLYLSSFPAEPENANPEYGLVAFKLVLKEKYTYECFIGGMNEKGLAFSFHGLPDVPLHPEKYVASEDSPFRALRECFSVEHIVEMTENNNWNMKGQYHFADASGDAIMISVAKPGKATCLKRNTGDGYLISRIIYHPQNKKDSSIGSSTAAHMLKEKQDDITLDYFVSILDAIHEEGTSANTIFSYGFDLHTHDIHIIYFHQFQEVYKTNVSDQLVNLQPEEFEVLLTSLFSQKTKNEALSEFQKYQKDFYIEAAVKIGLIMGVFVVCFYILSRLFSQKTKD
jgi:hypothetical protein